MIKQKTVLILGAGSSKPYGLPLGRDLLIGLCKLSQWLPKKLVPIFDEAGFSAEDVTSFGSALQRSGAKSVDTFLAQRPEFNGVGKLAIACELCPREDAAAFHPGLDDHWYMHLWERMTAGVGKGKDIPDANQLRVITFNYDRSLEFFLYNVLKNYYAMSMDDAQATLNRLQIMHMYGVLAPFHHAGLHGGLAYGPHQHPIMYAKAAAGINVIAEARAETPAFVDARGWLKEAESICFVGFGFDQLNLERLQVARALNDRPNRPYVCASVLRMTDAEIARAKAQIVPNFEWWTRPMLNLEFLRNMHVLL